MLRPESKPTPWIESLIQSYGAADGNSREGKYLEAHVTAVGEMTQSQAVSCKGHTGLVFLSDGVVQVPAILTTAAWELLQEEEEKECFTSLLSTTVFIRNYRLQFHMAAEQTKSRFFLSVGELSTKSVSPVRVMTPCCTSLPSVQLKIIKTWKSLLGQDSQKSQSHLDLSELLGEWQLDCLETVLQDVRERLAKARDAAQQPSTSNTVCHSGVPGSTGWDVDRVRYKDSGTFSIPTQYLLIPEENARLGQVQKMSSPQMPSRLCAPSAQTTPPSVGGSDQQISEPAPGESKPGSSSSDHGISEPAPGESKPGTSSAAASPVQGSVLLKNAISGMMDDTTRPLVNPWDIFPPPGDTSSSSEESEKASTLSAQTPTSLKSPPQRPAMLTSTQLPAFTPDDTHSFLPPYQKPASIFPTPSVTSSEHSPHPKSNVPRSDPVSWLVVNDASVQEEAAETKCGGKAKRKRSEPVAEELTPSWGSSGSDESSDLLHHHSVRKTPTTHSDGTPFTYSYQVSGQNLQDFSRYKVDQSVLSWAIKYLTQTQASPSAL